MTKSRKSSGGKTHAPRPQPAQIDAIERMLREGRVGDAQARLERLRAEFPGFKPLLAAEQLDALGEGQLLPEDYLEELQAACSPDVGTEDGRKLDLCRVLLDAGRAAEAIEAGRGIAHPRGDNNIGLALF